MEETFEPFEEPPVESILAADIGRVWTRLVLLDRVEGEYRFVARSDAPTSAEPPAANVMVGLQVAIEQIENLSGKILLDREGNLISPERADGSGVDLFVATSSAAHPLEVAVAGLVEHLSVASARRAALSTYSRITHTFALDSRSGRWGQPRGSIGVVEQLYEGRPDAVIIAGGTEGGASTPLLEFVDALGLAAQALPDGDRPMVIFAGNQAAAEEIGRRLSQVVDYRQAGNIRPDGSGEETGATAVLMDNLFRERRLERVPGLATIESWASVPVLPSVEAMARVIRFLAARGDHRVLCVDVGASHTTIIAAFGAEATHTMVLEDLGTGPGLAGILAHSRVDDLLGWVPGSGDAEMLVDILASFQLRPRTRAEAAESMALLQAAAREAIRLSLAQARPAWSKAAPEQEQLLPAFDMILLSGDVLRETPNPAQAVLIALDALQPAGVTFLQLDRVGFVPAIGALAGVVPSVAITLLDGASIEELGTVVAPIGHGRPGESVLDFRLTLPDGGHYDLDIEYGRIYREWLPPGVTTRLSLRPRRGFDVGAGPGKALDVLVTGGTAGLVIDARGRPLSHEQPLSDRRALAEAWRQGVGA